MSENFSWHQSRRVWIAGSAAVAASTLVFGLSSCSATGFLPNDETHAFKITPELNHPGAAANRRILGSNVGWAFGGDNMLKEDGVFDDRMLSMARAMAPTMLRFPGGTFSDVFHWAAPMNEHVFTKKRQPTLMNTQRFLELCESVGAEPLITVNTVTGSPEEAAQWVLATNISGIKSRLTGRPLPRVQYWEIGNEPYLKEQSRKDIDLAPSEFGRRVNSFISAMRKVDPAISIGIPLTNDSRAGVPVTPYPGFTRTVLSIVTQKFDYVSLHNAYMPFGFKNGMKATELYWGASAGALTVKSDLEAMTKLLSELRPGQRLPIAITEYGPIFSLGKGSTDDLGSSPAGAIYLADVLRVFAESPEVLLATHWSLSANWLFGSIHAKGYPRPAFQVFRLMRDAIEGVLVPVRVSSATVDVAGIGQVESVRKMPLVAAMATRDKSSLKVLMINKDPERTALGRIDWATTPAARAGRLTLLTTDNVLDTSDGPDMLIRTERALNPLDTLRLPPHSVALATFEL